MPVSLKIWHYFERDGSWGGSSHPIDRRTCKANQSPKIAKAYA
jgi:hypothetical protein